MGQYSREQYNKKIQDLIKVFDNYEKEYKYIGKDKDGLYLYDDIPNYDKEENVFSILNEKFIVYISIYSGYNTNVEEDILGLFKDGEIILISEGIKKIETLIDSPVDKLFKLLSEVQGVEIKPYDKFEIKDVDNNLLLFGPYYLDENFIRYDRNNEFTLTEKILRGLLTGKCKILKCKKAVVLTEDDIICLRYYLKNGYKYITNNVYFDGIMKYRIKGFKEEPKLTQNSIYWNYTEDTDIFYIKDKLGFIHYEYPEIWDIEELLEQERVSND